MKAIQINKIDSYKPTKFSDTLIHYEATNCDGLTDDEVKAAIGYSPKDSAKGFQPVYDEDYKRVDDHRATWTRVSEYLD